MMGKAYQGVATSDMLLTGLILLTAGQWLVAARPTDQLSTLNNENIYARLWRTALTGPPLKGSEDGWPHYTTGAHNNTPHSDTAPGVYVKTDASGWTSGFFPDSLWQAYRRRLETNRPAYPSEPTAGEWLAMAQAWTNPLSVNSELTNTHDLGFMAKPFESAMQINGDDWLPVLQNMSTNLGNRFEPGAGVIRSWDCANDSVTAWCSHADSVLVIIDNMMNLALLARSASTYTHNTTLLDIARSHADNTILHHVRTDGSSFHVCDYSATTGDVYLCRTAQGLADASTWARGQAWGWYGFAEFFSLTGNVTYLETAVRMADYFVAHLPDDGLPFWDFDAVYEPGVTPRDSSAAAVAASGLVLLQEQLDGCGGYEGDVKHDYRQAAMDLLAASEALALAGEVTFRDLPPLGASTDLSTPANTPVSGGVDAILLHGTSNNNPKVEQRNFDTGLSYGDFYLIEAVNRLVL